MLEGYSWHNVTHLLLYNLTHLSVGINNILYIIHPSLTRSAGALTCVMYMRGYHRWGGLVLHCSLSPIIHLIYNLSISVT